MPGGELIVSYNFLITLNRSPGTSGGRAQLGDGAFQECQGLELSMEALEFPEGGRNDGVIQRIGRGKYVPIVLKRGMLAPVGGTADPVLWVWIQNVLAGVRPLPRYDGVIEVLDHTGQDVVVARWEFDRGLPTKISGPQLNARTGEIAIEELTIAHEGLRLAT